MVPQLTLIAISFAFALFGGMLLFIELGRRLGVRQLARDPLGARAGVGVVEGSVFGLLALLIGFTFSGAASRFDDRRLMIAQEVNAIGTAWLRIDLLPPEPQAAIRDGFRRYLDARLAAYQALPDRDGFARELAVAARAQDDIWTRAVAACRAEGGEPARMLLIPALNEMFDIAEARRLALRVHPPVVIFVMLAIAALAAALFAGYSLAGGSTRNWAYMVGCAATTAIAVYVIVDLEFPRFGLIRVESFDLALVELRATLR